MMPVSSVSTGAAQPIKAAEGTSPAQKPEQGTENRRIKRLVDEYVPTKPQERSGRYWMGQDEDGHAKICFDSPDQENEEEEICSTDKVDREIEKLKKKRRELERQLNAETDETRLKDLERQLAQVKQELKRKDNDTYRRQNAEFTQHS